MQYKMFDYIKVNKWNETVVGAIVGFYAETYYVETKNDKIMVVFNYQNTELIDAPNLSKEFILETLLSFKNINNMRPGTIYTMWTAANYNMFDLQLLSIINKLKSKSAWNIEQQSLYEAVEMILDKIKKKITV